MINASEIIVCFDMKILNLKLSSALKLLLVLL